MSKGEVLGLVLSKGEVLPFCVWFQKYIERRFWFEKGEYIYLRKRNKSDLKIKKMLMWKIVESSNASIIYIYIDYLFLLVNSVHRHINGIP